MNTLRGEKGELQWLAIVTDEKIEEESQQQS